MRITINEIGQQQRQHTIETAHTKLLPMLQETSASYGLHWIVNGQLQPHIRVYVNHQPIANPETHSLQDNDVIDLISPMAGG